MTFLVNKREQIWDDMVIHLNKSSLSYKDICKHYINALNSTVYLHLVYFEGGCMITGRMSDGHLPILTLRESLKSNEQRVLTKVKTTENGIEVMTERIGNSEGCRTKDTSNNSVSKTKIIMGKVKGNSLRYL